MPTAVYLLLPGLDGNEGNRSAFALLHLGLRHCSTISQPSYSCGTRWLVGNKTMPYTGARHLLPLVKYVLLHIGQHRLDLRLDGRLLCHCRSHGSSPFWPPEDVVQEQQDDNTGHDYLCHRTRDIGQPNRYVTFDPQPSRHT